MKDKRNKRMHTTLVTLQVPLDFSDSMNAPYPEAESHFVDIGDEDEDLSIYTRSATSVEPFNNDYIQSYQRYVYWNSVRFILICGVVLGIAITRQMTLHYYYNEDRCCFCFEMAYINEKYISHTQNHTIFEWASCQYDIAIKQENINNQCFEGKQLENISNLSTDFDLFASKYYYMITALIVFVIALIYSIITIIRAYNIKNNRKLMRDCLYHLLYNIIISIMCFYQILIDYQYYKHHFTFYQNENGDLPPPTLTDANCYINALNNTTENMIKGVLISAGVYFIIPCFVECFLHCSEDNYVTNIIRAIYNWLMFVFGIAITFTFLCIVIYFTYGVLRNYEWQAPVVVIAIDIGLILSFFDILFFKIRDYAKIPFIKILRLICCCYYKLCTNAQQDNHKFIPYRYPSVGSDKHPYN